LGFDAPLLVEGRHIAVGASLGIAFYPRDGADMTALISIADARMYEMKRAGRVNRWNLRALSS
jgi:GGDEF domain-containing protein